MQSIVANRFSRLLQNIQPTSRERERYERHYSTVRSSLRAVFPDARVSRMGSQDRDTAIRGHSDLDVLLQLSHREIRWGGEYMSSRTVLSRVRGALASRYPHTEIRVDGPAVVANFGGHPVDVVPAVFLLVENGAEKLAIPNGRGEWMHASPKAHGRYLTQADAKAGGKLKYTVQLLKFWRHTRVGEIPIQSFYAELVLATRAVCVGGKSYAACLCEAFIALMEARTSLPVDPLGISDVIEVARTAAKTNRVYTALGRTVDQAIKACLAEERGNEMAACDWWDKVFFGYFPRT
jgi:hypothetical protein